MSFLRRPRIQAKSDAELHKMRAAGLVVAGALAAVRESAVPGATPEELDTIAREFIGDAGATPSFLGYHGFPASLCISVNQVVVHGIPDRRPFEAGDLVSIDGGAILDGWHGDAAISLIAGGREAGSAADLALLDDTEASLWAGIAALRVGERLFAVGEAVEETVMTRMDQRNGTGLPDLVYGVIEDFTGHGIGREMHMDPEVPNYAVADKGPTVPSGTTVAIEPMVTLGTIETRTLDDDWTVVTADGSRACHWEHTVAVTGAGLWVLTAADGGAAGLTAAGAASSFAPLR